MKTLILFFNLIIAASIHGQSYFEYQRVFNRIDEDILAKNYLMATLRLDSIENTYKFIYARHCIKALQICCANNDSFNSKKWLLRSFKQGVPLWIIRTNELTRKSLNYYTTQYSIQKFDSFDRIYKNSINHKIVRRIDSLLLSDQEYTAKVNDGFFLFRHTLYGLQWLKNNKRQFKEIDDIIDKYGFPGERLIGLPSGYNDSASLVKNTIFYGPDISDTRTYIMLIHYFSNPRKDINDKLLKNVINGYLPSQQFGAFNDFMACWGKKKYGNYEYYNIWHHDPNIKNNDSINFRRNSIGLNTFDKQQRNMLIARERRKTKRANSEIILE